MFLIQQFCPLVERHTPEDERDENTGWVTLLKFDNEDDAIRIAQRPYSDGRKRQERVINTKP
jgi:hypothetical protein